MGLTAKFRQTKDLVVVLVLGKKKRHRRFTGAFLDLYFNRTRSTITKTPIIFGR
jgi:hypothetical protein